MSRKERGYRYSVVVPCPDPKLGDDVQTVEEDAFRLAPVGLHRDFFDVSVHILAHIVAPDKSYHHEKQHLAGAVRAEKADVALQQGDSLLRVGVPSLGQHGEHQRIGDPFMGDGQHEDVDDRLPELPVGAVNGQRSAPRARQEPVKEAGDEVLAEVKFRKEPLDSPQTRLCFRRRVETVGQQAEAHCFCLLV